MRVKKNRDEVLLARISGVTRRVRINIKKLVCHGAATSRRKTDRRSRVPKKLS